MTIEIRRRAAEKAFQKAQERGQPIEQDERFRGWIEEWIAGDIEMSEVATRYRGLVAELAELKHRSPLSGPEMSREVVNDEKKETDFDLESEINRMMEEETQKK